MSGIPGLTRRASDFVLCVMKRSKVPAKDRLAVHDAEEAVFDAFEAMSWNDVAEVKAWLKKNDENHRLRGISAGLGLDIDEWKGQR